MTYRADATVDRGITVIQAVLSATSELAREHGGTPLRLPLDRHPNARAARAIAHCITSESRGRLTLAGSVGSHRTFDRLPNRFFSAETSIKVVVFERSLLVSEFGQECP